MRARLASLGNLTANAKDARMRQFVDGLHAKLISDKHSETVTSFASAVQIHKQLVGGSATAFNPNTLFTDPTLRTQFGVTAADELTTATVINGNPARSKEIPNTNVQAMMAYELMTKGLSVGFWIESRDLRAFDTHRSRGGVMSNLGQSDQLGQMNANLWTPLKALVARLKATPYGTSGATYFDNTTIVLCSDMGRVLNGDVSAILASADSNSLKYTNIMDQDVCQHWRVSSTAFLGGTVKGNMQYGRVGSNTLEAIPILPTGALDPAYDPTTGELKAGMTKSATSFVSDAGHVYATALHLSGLDPTALTAAGKGKNTRPPMTFIKK
jgi:hypothetical protein